MCGAGSEIWHGGFCYSSAASSAAEPAIEKEAPACRVSSGKAWEGEPRRRKKYGSEQLLYRTHLLLYTIRVEKGEKEGRTKGSCLYVCCYLLVPDVLCPLTTWDGLLALKKKVRSCALRLRAQRNAATNPPTALAAPRRRCGQNSCACRSVSATLPLPRPLHFAGRVVAILHTAHFASLACAIYAMALPHFITHEKKRKENKSMKRLCASVDILRAPRLRARRLYRNTCHL